MVGVLTGLHHSLIARFTPQLADAFEIQFVELAVRHFDFAALCSEANRANSFSRPSIRST